MQRLRETITLILIALLPFHAFMVTVLTKIIAGPGHAPLPMIALWKEGLLLVIALLAVVEFFCATHVSETPSNGVSTRSWRMFDVIHLLIIGLVILSLIVTGLTHQNWILYAFGFKYDFLPLGAFLVLRRVPWSELFIDRVAKTIIGAAIIIVLYGFLTLILRPSDFGLIGYSDLHSLYNPDGPLAPFQQIGGTAIRRMQSVMSGPNQLGIWLLIPWTIVVLRLIQRKLIEINFILMLLIGSGILLTFSRAAWIAVAVIFSIALFRELSRSLFQRIGIFLVLGFCVLLVALSVVKPEILLRVSSSRDHLALPLKAITTMIEHPFGLGLGMAGPASNRVSETCVMLEGGADVSWAADRPNLCVFVSDVQVQPGDRICNCPFLTENWYLQIGVELGFLGFIWFLVLSIFVLHRLSNIRGSEWIFLAFLGISVAALFLHAWEDAAVAMTLWILLSPLLQEKRL